MEEQGWKVQAICTTQKGAVSKNTGCPAIFETLV